ncbi:MAG: carbohydrate kinase, partial [Bacteroidales bacterium]|nr:carbohydrate kinase [Bacteroidales bacterium]
MRLEYENKNPVVVGIGEFLWDMLPDGKKVGGAPV